MNQEKDLLVVGNLAKDIIFDDIRMGGCAASIAVNSQRFGLRTGIMSVLGVDRFSKEYYEFLSAEKIDVRLVSSCLDNLPVCQVTSKDNLISSSIWIDNGCHPAMATMPIDRNTLQEYSLIHLVSCPPELAKRISDIPSLRLSYEPGPMLTVEPNYFDPLIGDRSALIFFNQEEFDIVMNKFGYSRIEDLVKKEGTTLIVTNGKNGSDIYRLNNGTLNINHIDAKLVDNVVDNTGAGDAYKSGFFSKYLQGSTLVKSCEYGSLVASLSVQQKGGILSNELIHKIKDD